MNTTFRKPYIKVDFTSVSGDKYTVDNADFGGDIVSVITNKSMGQDVAGNFTIQMICRHNFVKLYKDQNYGSKELNESLYEIMRPSGLVDIYINGKEVMIGMIDSVRKTYSATETGKRIFIISGRDLGALLVDHKVWWDDSLGGMQRNINSLLAQQYLYGPIGDDGPARMIEKTINVWFYQVLNNIGLDTVFSWADGSKIWEKLVACREDEASYSVTYNQAVRDPATGRPVIVGGKPQIVSEILSPPVAGPGALASVAYGDFYPMNFSAWDNQTDLYSFVKGFCAFPFNELWVDTGDTQVVLGSPRMDKGNGLKDVSVSNLVNQQGDIRTTVIPQGLRVSQLAKQKAYVIFRPSPFDDSILGVEPNNFPSLLSFQDLDRNPATSNHITDDDIQSKDLNIGRNGIPSMYVVNPTQSFITGAASKYFVAPEYDDRAFTRYGHNPMEINVDSFNLLSKFGDGPIKDIVSNMQKKLKRWFMISDKIMTGSMTIKGREGIRIGQSLYYDRTANDKIEEDYEEGYYYVTGVTHNYVYGNNFTTTLMLDRGISKMLSPGIKDDLYGVNASEIMTRMV